MQLVMLEVFILDSSFFSGSRRVVPTLLEACVMYGNVLFDIIEYTMPENGF